MSKIKYEIYSGNHAPCELWSAVVGPTWWNRKYEFKNFVCDGTYNYCKEIKERLENED